jgi:hypothetical protein
MGDSTEAIKTLKAMIEADTQDTSLYYRLEFLQIRSRDWRGVSETINRVAEVAPEETDAIIQKGIRTTQKLCAVLSVLILLGWSFMAIRRR